MKRSAPSSDQSIERQTSRRRQDPVSCTVCRKKKLKCSRTFPCSNCVSRGLKCEPPGTSQLNEDGDRCSSVAASDQDSNVLARVLERLQRLEDAVLTKQGECTRSQTSSSSDSSSTVVHEDVSQNNIFHLLGRSDPMPSTSVEEDEARNMEMTGSRQVSKTDDASNFLFISAPVSELVSDLGSRNPILTSISVVDRKVIRRICLPSNREAHVLFSSYAKSLGSWYHVYHKHTIESLLDRTYHAIAAGCIPQVEHVALLLSIFANGAYFQAYADWPESIFSSPDEANQICLIWQQNALDMLDSIERASTPSSVEQLQATVIMSLLTQNLEGLSKKYWLLHGTSITLARDLSLHVLDHPTRKTAQRSLIEDEVKRRLWWYLAGTDWLLGSMPSPQEGTYTINPRQCFVKPPMNVDDDELTLGGEVKDRPLSEPTEMSYFIVRMNGAEMCRTFADLVYPLACGVNNVNYDEIVALEQRTAKLTEKIPFYFQLDEESRKRTEPYLKKYPQLATQRYLLSQGLHCHRSRIHRPFLIRGSMDKRFGFSRKACLESIRKSLEIRRLLNQEKRGLVLPIARLNFVVYHVFMGALTLALDLCFNKSTSEAEDQTRREELKNACSMLQDSRTSLPTADRFLNPLLDLLRKHKIHLQDAEPQDCYLTPSDSTGTPDKKTATTSNLVSSDQDLLSQVQFAESSASWNPTLAPDPNLDFDDLWQEFLTIVPKSNVPGWDNLFADLDQMNASMG